MVQRGIITHTPENLVNSLHDWVETSPNVIQYTNVSDSIFFKINGTLVKKQKHLIQISVWEIKNDLIIKVSQGGFYGARNEYDKVCIRDTSLRNYMHKKIKPMRNRNNITCGCETCISAMLLKSNLNQ